MSSAALVGTDGSIDWCCFPRFDSPSVFAAILDEDVGGRFKICPAGPSWNPSQQYLPDTNVLETTFRTENGRVSITDFMPVSDDDNPDTPPVHLHEIHRIVTCLSGDVQMRCDFQPRHNYGRNTPVFRMLRGNSAVEARGGRQTMTLLTTTPLTADESGAYSNFTLSAGQSAVFVLAYGHGRPTSVERFNTPVKLDQTRRYWQDLVAHMDYQGLWRDAIVRSFLVLHLMMFRDTGAIVASPTTSLPETIGGTRNWDYRFAWLRDSAFTVDILYRLGDYYGADRYIHWLLEQCKLTEGNTSIVYGISRGLVAQGADAGPPFGIQGLAARAHRQRSGAPPAAGRLRGGHNLHPLAAAAGGPYTPSGVGAGAVAGRDRHVQLAASRPRHLGGARRAEALRVLQGDVLGGAGPGRLHCG